MPLDFSPYQAVLLDLDGTLYHEDHALPGAIELVKRLQAEGRNFACLSNSSASPLRIMARLEDMGLDVDPNNIYTAAAAACDYVIEQFPPGRGGGDELVDKVWGADGGGVGGGGGGSGASPSPALATAMAAARRKAAAAAKRKARVFNLATESVDDMLQGLVDWVGAAADACDAIIVGPPSSTFATEERQRTALELARRGSAIVGVCADRVYPSPRGVEFGAGALTWMLAYAAGVEPVFCGKPERIFFHELCQRLNAEPEWCLLVGDNLESDVCGGKSVGMRTILTLSGVTRARDLASVPEDLQPDLVVEDLRELL